MVASVSQCPRCPPSDPPKELMCFRSRGPGQNGQGKRRYTKAKETLADSWTAFPHFPPQPPSSAAKLAGGAQPYCR